MTFIRSFLGYNHLLHMHLNAYAFDRLFTRIITIYVILFVCSEWEYGNQELLEFNWGIIGRFSP